MKRRSDKLGLSQRLSLRLIRPLAEQGRQGVAENEIEKLVVDSAVTVHRELGSGLLETVYEVFIIDDLSTGGSVEDRKDKC